MGGSTTFPQSDAGSSVTVDAKTIIDNLKFVFMGSLGAHNGRWGMFTDVIYMDLGNTKSGTRDISDRRPAAARWCRGQRELRPQGLGLDARRRLARIP